MKFERLVEIISLGKTEIKQSEKSIIISFVFKDMSIEEAKELNKYIKKDVYIENGKLKFNVLTIMGEGR